MKRIFFVIPLFFAFATAVQAAPNYFSQINALNLPYRATGNGVVVAILDNGVDLDHPDLQDNIWINKNESIAPDGIDNDNNGYIDDIWGWDFAVSTSSGFVRNDPRPKVDGTDRPPTGMGHGTGGAGFVAAFDNLLFSTAGLAPQAKIMAIRVMDSDGRSDEIKVASAIRYAMNNGANVINLSLVGFNDSSRVREAIQEAFDRNIVVVAAAGNGDASSDYGINLNLTPAYPICYVSEKAKKQMIGVASVDKTGKIAEFSNYGSNCISISAPGDSLTGLSYISSTMGLGTLGYGYSIWSGTSFSAPLVSATAALIKSVRPDLPAGKIIDLIIKSASSLASANPALVSGELGAGLLDVKSAVNLALAVPSAKLVKTKNNPAVYLIDTEGVRHLFVYRSIYDSWFGSWKTAPKIEIITQENFEQLVVGANMTFRPGFLIKFDSSSFMYAVLSGNSLCRLADDPAAKKLLGEKWRNKLKSSSLAEFNNYKFDDNCILASSSIMPSIAVAELIASQ